MFPLPDVPSKFDPSYWTQVGEWIEDVAGRHLRATENTDAFPTAASDLVDHIWSEIRISTNGHHPWERRYGVTSEALDTRVWAKAEHMLATFMPAVPRGPFKGRFTRPFTTEESRRGGRASKRSSRVLEGLRALPADTTAAAAADILGCSERAVYRARAILKVEQRERSFEDELAELFPEVEDDNADAAKAATIAGAVGPDPFAGLLDVQPDFGTDTGESAPEAPVGSTTGMIPISIRTGQPMTPLDLAIEQIRREDEARPYADLDGFLRAVGL